MFEPGGTTASDAEPQTVEAFLARRPSGLDDVYRLYGSRLYAVARDVLGNVEDAQDCVHDALLRIWQRPPVYRPERGALRAYLVVAIRNEAISRKRATMRHLVIEERAAKTDSPGYEVELQDHVGFSGCAQRWTRFRRSSVPRSGLPTTDIYRRVRLPSDSVFRSGPSRAASRWRCASCKPPSESEATPATRGRGHLEFPSR